MKTSTSCAPQTCDSAIAERPRYFPRQIITADDLSLDQEYARNARRLHNRMLHGWGVVCGAKVCPVPATAGNAGFQPWVVSVCPGYILGPCGDEILIDCCKTVDVRTSGTKAVTGDPCVQTPDPWCTDVFVQTPAAGRFYIAVQYKQIRARPVRVQPVGCGCDDSSCEYSRWRDGYEIGVLPNYKCPTDAPDLDPDGNPNLNLLVRGDMMDCPALPPDPWVVLAVVNVDADGTIHSIDNCTCRRWVASFGSFWWACHSTQVAVASFDSADTTVDFQNLKPDSTKALTGKAHITAGTLSQPPASTASLGQGITIKDFQVTPPAPAGQDITLTFIVESNAPAALAGARDLTLKNGDCAITIFPNAIRVVTVTVTAAKAPAKKKVK